MTDEVRVPELDASQRFDYPHYLDGCSLVKWDGDPGNCRWCNEPLKRNKDGSLHKTRRYCKPGCSDAYGRNHFWTTARYYALERDGGRCVRCESTRSLEVHHKTQVFGRHGEAGCHHHLDGLETLCWDCHRAVEHQRKAS